MPEFLPVDFVSGAIAAGYVVLGLLFLRFWRSTRDALFANFSAAFWLLAMNQAGTTISRSAEFETTWVYVLRLVAFLVIIAAIVRKNMRRSGL
jgi:hypothetical protein